MHNGGQLWTGLNFLPAQADRRNDDSRDQGCAVRLLGFPGDRVLSSTRWILLWHSAGDLIARVAVGLPAA